MDIFPNCFFFFLVFLDQWPSVLKERLFCCIAEWRQPLALERRRRKSRIQSFFGGGRKRRYSPRRMKRYLLRLCFPNSLTLSVGSESCSPRSSPLTWFSESAATTVLEGDSIFSPPPYLLHSSSQNISKPNGGKEWFLLSPPPLEKM